MSREYLAVLLAAVICVLMLTEASGQPTVDDDGTCDRGLLTSEQVANLIRKGVEKVLASNQQRLSPMEPSKHSLVSALVCKYHCDRPCCPCGDRLPYRIYRFSSLKYETTSLNHTLISLEKLILCSRLALNVSLQASRVYSSPSCHRPVSARMRLSLVLVSPK